jgi:hypothetical protein
MRRRGLLRQRHHELQTLRTHMNNVLRILLAIVAGVSGLAACAQYLSLLPAGTVPDEWIKHALAASVLMLALKEGVVVIGDILDDGERNNSFFANRGPKPEPKPPTDSPTKRLLVGLLFIGLVSFAVMTASCTGPQWQAAQARLMDAGLRVVEATGKAAATAALAEAEAELTKLETAPLRPGATQAEILGRAAAIEEGRRLVADLRRKVFAWSIRGGKQPIFINP